MYLKTGKQFVSRGVRQAVHQPGLWRNNCVLQVIYFELRSSAYPRFIITIMPVQIGSMQGQQVSQLMARPRLRDTVRGVVGGWDVREISIVVH